MRIADAGPPRHKRRSVYLARVSHASTGGIRRRPVSRTIFCVRTVSDRPEAAVKHRDLRGHFDAHRCCGKSLMGSALVRFGVRYARGRNLFPSVPFNHSDISPSLESTACERSDSRLSHIRRQFRSVSRSHFDSAAYDQAPAPRRSNCVRPSNLVGPLTAFPRSRRRGSHDPRGRTQSARRLDGTSATGSPVAASANDNL